MSVGDSSATVVEEPLVSFIDNATVAGVGSGAGNHAFSAGDATLATDIANFFARPVRIDSYVWLESDVQGIVRSIAPWKLWANNAYVRNKLNNYSWFRGDLKFKVQMTASPFYYGKMMLSYQPLPVFSPNTLVYDAGIRYFTAVSQRPHIVLEPGKCDSYEMTLPFIYPANWLNIQKSQDTEDMGTLNSIIYSVLQSANGVSGTGINITTYAWIENIELSGASVGYAMQSDEFGQGSVSKPASWVAKTASYFENIPIIGTFATATKIGASAVSTIASLFGFTNVPVIEDTKPFRNEPFPKFSSSEIGYPVERLTLDPKNELSIDPRIVGLPNGIDEMAISHIVGRESWLTKINWSSADALDTMMFYCRVNPLLYDNDGATQAKLYYTPVGYIAGLFDAWRGDVIFRFHIVASKYHKGKLLINFDPTGYTAQNIGNTVATSNVVHTSIIDIGETQNVEFRVPYQMATQFLTIRPSVSVADKGWAVKTTVPTPYPADVLYDNGLITMRVLNALTAPVASSNVDIHVYVRAAENMEFANPTEVDGSHTLSFYAPQSEELTELPSGDKLNLSKTRGGVENQYVVHYGENIKSLRALLRRYSYVGMEPVYPSGTSAFFSYFYKNFLKMPMSPGFAPLGYSSVTGIVVATPFPYNYVNMTPLTYLAPAFLCYRGSVNWSFNVTGSNQFGHLRVLKDNTSGSDAGVGTVSGSGNTFNKLSFRSLRVVSGAAGSAVTNQLTQGGLNVQVPNMSIFKFQSTAWTTGNRGLVADGSLLDNFRLEGDWLYPSTSSGNPSIIHSYVAAGTDFSLHYFLNVPTFYIYSSIPAPA